MTRARIWTIGMLGTLFILSASVLGAQGCDAEEGPEQLTKDQVRARGQGKADDGTDYCEAYNWYGDGECDDFCPKPDPDCGEPAACDPTEWKACGDDLYCIADSVETGEHGECMPNFRAGPLGRGYPCGGSIGASCAEGLECVGLDPNRVGGTGTCDYPRNVRTCDPKAALDCGDFEFCVAEDANDQGVCEHDWRGHRVGRGYPCGGRRGIECARGLVCAGLDPNDPDHEGSCELPDTPTSCDPTVWQSCGSDLYCIADSVETGENGECLSDPRAGSVGRGYTCGGSIGVFCAEGLVCVGEVPSVPGSTGVCDYEN